MPKQKKSKEWDMKHPKGTFEGNYACRELVMWAYENGIKLGLEQGLRQGKTESLVRVVVRFVEIRFPDLVPLVLQKSLIVANHKNLQEILEKLFAAHSDKEAKAALLNEQA